MILIFSYTWLSMHYADDELSCKFFFFEHVGFLLMFVLDCAFVY